MWPWGHLAVGYLLYSVTMHVSARRPPDGYATLALAFGTQFPDLVDKPLAWTFGILPNGRSLTHSLLTAILLIIALKTLLRRRNYDSIVTAFGIGYLSHLMADALTPAIAGDYYSLGFLAWPIAPAIEYSIEPSFTAHIQELSLTPSVAFELALGVVVLLLWLHDGAPGVGVVKRVPKWVEQQLSA